MVVISCLQVRKLLQKVVTDDSLRYKKLVERAVSPSKEENDQPSDLGNNNRLTLSNYLLMVSIYLFFS